MARSPKCHEEAPGDFWRAIKEPFATWTIDQSIDFSPEYWRKDHEKSSVAIVNDLT